MNPAPVDAALGSSLPKVDAGGVRWHVPVIGRGPTMLLLHGTGASSRSFRALAPLLAAHFTIIVPDLPGHAQTSMPASLSGMSVDGMAASLAALLRGLAARPTIAVGHSAGAAILVRMVLDGTLSLQALVGLNPALMPLDGPTRFLSPMAKLLARTPGFPHLVSRLAGDDHAVQRFIGGLGSKLDDEGASMYGALVRDHRHVAGAVAMMAGWDLDRTYAEMSSLKPPPLLIVGGDDRAIPPRQARRVAERVPGTEVVVMPGLGHLAHEEQPAWTASMIVGHAVERGVLPTTQDSS